MICTDESTKSVVLAIRGTASGKDAIVDAVAIEMEFLDGYAHVGMVRSAKRIIDESSQILKKAFETYPGYRFVITGHSLGGGTAILTTMLVLSRNDIGVDPKKVKCIAVAPPPVFRSNESHRWFEDHIQIFINQDDIVPRQSIY
jgi:sn1-specific diacylglycerol lipase